MTSESVELRINKSMWRAKHRLDSRGLKMAPEKTEALLVTDRKILSVPEDHSQRA